MVFVKYDWRWLWSRWLYDNADATNVRLVGNFRRNPPLNTQASTSRDSQTNARKR
jgi:hypothetical protein